MIEQLEAYAKHLNASDEVLGWIRTTGKKSYTKAFASLQDLTGEIEHIVDFFVSPAAPRRLQKMSYADAKRKAAEWSKGQQKKGRNLTDESDDIELVHDFLDGTRIVKLLTKKAYQREGFLMGHCVGGYSPGVGAQEIYSYRDSKNMPHATFEVQRGAGQIMQVKGKGNGPIHPRYIQPILEFLRTIGLKIRTHEMKNLGYHHLSKEQLSFIKTRPRAMRQVAVLSGEAYAVELLGEMRKRVN